MGQCSWGQAPRPVNTRHCPAFSGFRPGLGFLRWEMGREQAPKDQGRLSSRNEGPEGPRTAGEQLAGVRGRGRRAELGVCLQRSLTAEAQLAQPSWGGEDSMEGAGPLGTGSHSERAWEGRERLLGPGVKYLRKEGQQRRKEGSPKTKHLSGGPPIQAATTSTLTGSSHPPARPPPLSSIGHPELQTHKGTRRPPVPA